jgi:hypothetical protein
MNTEEMYRRGVADAEKGDPHPFYYQHYYQYRRGYDHARRRLGLPGGAFDPRRWRNRLLAVAALVAIAASLFVWRGRMQAISGGAPQISPSTLAATASPTRTPIFATPTPEPTATPLLLGVGGTATVTNTQGAALRGRKEPGVSAVVTASFKEGEQLRVVEGPVEADGFTWWRVEGPSGTGWSAQQSKEGVVWLQPVAVS